ncbi:LysR family transcriptional regulator [Phenylobacterium aquaticum]|uniref:LysR family transcriptional regulator n=1 Tax=Phenylobacterium aquaticum TaxID=1763816 RepID=UPI001F5CA2C3|nr:LysR family transcriptional regulator [Phenylobacterium aquaticum]MCI3133631.1 LysR family transcriptional regulator [Phenylobacterium aquaticum]
MADAEAGMDDLNDLALFAAVARQESFTAAARRLGVPKSRVSRRVAALEKRLGVRLLQRSTRAVHVTDVGRAFLAHCEAMTQSARAALEVAEHAGDRPSGRLLVSCPIGVAHIFLAEILPNFLKAHPDVRLELDLTNRRVDVIGEGYDVALRVRSVLEDSELALRSFGVSEQLLVGSPEFVAEHGPFPDLASLGGVRGMGPAGRGDERPRWRLRGTQGDTVDVEYRPVLLTDDVYLLHQAALRGAGLAQTPFNLCAAALRDGRLIEVLPDHRLPSHQLHAVFPSRRGLAPSVRAFLEFLAAELPSKLDAACELYRETAEDVLASRRERRPSARP